MWSVKYRPNPGSATISARRASGAGEGWGVRVNGALIPETVLGATTVGRPSSTRRQRHVGRSRTAASTTVHSGRAPADVDGRPVSSSPTPAAVSISASAMPVRSVGENVPEVVMPTALAVARARPSRRRGTPRPVARSPRSRRAGPAAFSASSASRPQNSGFDQPTAQPLPACTGVMSVGQVLAVQRVAHLGAQGVTGAEPGRAAAQRLRRREQRVPHARARRRPARAARSRARRCSRCGRPGSPPTSAKAM